MAGVDFVYVVAWDGAEQIGSEGVVPHLLASAVLLSCGARTPTTLSRVSEQRTPDNQCTIQLGASGGGGGWSGERVTGKGYMDALVGGGVAWRTKREVFRMEGWRGDGIGRAGSGSLLSALNGETSKTSNGRCSEKKFILEGTPNRHIPRQAASFRSAWRRKTYPSLFVQVALCPLCYFDFPSRTRGKNECSQRLHDWSNLSSLSDRYRTDGLPHSLHEINMEERSTPAPQTCPAGRYNLRRLSTKAINGGPYQSDGRGDDDRGARRARFRRWI